MVWINPAWNCKMVVKRLTAFFLKRYLLRVFFVFLGGGGGEEWAWQYKYPTVIASKFVQHFVLGQDKKEEEVQFAAYKYLGPEAKEWGNATLAKISVTCINLCWQTCLGDEQISSNDRENGGTLQMVSLIINPMHTLYGGHLLGPNPILKTWENMSFYFPSHSCGLSNLLRHATIFDLKIVLCPITRAVPKSSDCLLTVEESSIFTGFKQIPSD